MATFWMELHCDSIDDVDGCVNNDHSYFVQGTSQPSVTRRALMKQARIAGWREVGNVGFCCPACVRFYKCD